MELRPFRAMHTEPAFKERRPTLWIDRCVLPGPEGTTIIVPILVGLVRLSEKGIAMPPDGFAADAVAKRVGALVAAKADAEPCLVTTRAPLGAALATSQPADEVFRDDSGARHDLIRILDYARHVELQGLVKNAEAQLAAGRELWEAARQFAVSPAAAKLPGAKFKLCGIVDQQSLASTGRLPQVPAGVLGFSFEDAVY